MSKKLLNEAEMRRFMGLAGIRSNLVSNRIAETYGNPMAEDDEDPTDAASVPPGLDVPGEDVEEPPVPGLEEPEMMDQPSDMDAPAPENDALAGLSDEVKEQLFSAVAEAAAEVLDLEVELDTGEAAPEMGDVAPEMGDVAPEMGDVAPEDPAPEMGGEEEEEGVLEEIELELSEEEIVNEVARRVAKRLVKASKANKTLREALGRK
tara:strand:- start:4627 stop:5247 length:621 start_codon:yes stop_codon:yes gene_type:complete